MLSIIRTFYIRIIAYRTEKVNRNGAMQNRAFFCNRAFLIIAPDEIDGKKRKIYPATT